jgi:cytochrome P450
LYVKTLPGPTEPAIVQRLRYMRDPVGYLESCQRRYGDVFVLRLVKTGMVIVCSPDLAKTVYAADDDTLVAGEAKIAIFGKVLGQSSTLLLDGPRHLKRRRLMLPRFRGELMHTFEPVMRDAANGTLEAMPRGKPFALHPFMHGAAFEVILRALFSETPLERQGELRRCLHEFATKAVTSRLLMFPGLQRDLGPLSPWGRVTRVVSRAREAVLEEIRRRRASGRTDADITGLLVDARHDDGSHLSDEEVRDEILTMVAAGHETTSMALTWLCYAVFTRPGVLARLCMELAEHSVDGLARVDQLPYLDAVVRESLRYYSLIPNGSGRIVKRPFELGGYEVPARAMVSVAFHALHRRTDVFERANEFWPERFLQAKYTPFEWVPFGGGTRRCLGMPFALFEMKIVLAQLLRRYRLEVVQQDVRPAWRGMFLTPSEGLRVRCRPAHVPAAVATKPSEARV